MNSNCFWNDKGSLRFFKLTKVVLKARIKNADVIDEIMKDKNRISKRDKDKSIDDIAYELGCNLDLNERKEYILYKMNKSCKKYEESQYDETNE